MKWKKFKIKTVTDAEDIIISTLYDIGLEGAQIEDEEITEIMINGTQPIFIERNGRIYETEKKFLSKGKLEDVVQQMVAGCNRVVNEATPIVDAFH